MLRLQTNTQMPVTSLPHQGQFLQFNCTTDADYAFTNVPPTTYPLTPDQELSPIDFDTPAIFPYSEASSPSDSLPASPLHEEIFTAPTPDAAKPAPRLRSGHRVPRPRNAFMIFRSEFWAQSKISKSVEHDHRHISRIIGHCWNQLPEEEKDIWRRRAEQEKIEHSTKYPGYRFSPNMRTKQAVKRKVKRNGEDELLRCKQVADLLLAGKAGMELDHAVKSIDSSSGREISPPLVLKKKLAQAVSVSDKNDCPVFRSPLLPPAESQENALTRRNSCQISTSSTTSAEYQAKEPSSPYDQNWAIRYAQPQNTGQEEISYISQYPFQHQPSTSWISSQEPNDLGYSTPEEVYRGAPLNFDYDTLPPSSPFHVEFVNPFDYTAHDPPAGNKTQPPIDPFHWDRPQHRAN